MKRLVDKEGVEILCNKEQVEILLEAGVATELDNESNPVNATGESEMQSLSKLSLEKISEELEELEGLGEKNLQELYIAVRNTGDSAKLSAVAAAMDNPEAMEYKTVLDSNGRPIVPDSIALADKEDVNTQGKTVLDEDSKPYHPDAEEESSPEEESQAESASKKSVDEISEGSVADMKESLPSLTDGELVELLAKEKSGSKRQSAVNAIKAEIEERE